MKCFRYLMPALLALAMLSSCAKADAPANVGERTGLGVVTSVSSSKPADGNTEGTIEADTTVCALTLGDADRIVRVKFDVAQTKVNITGTGQISTNLTREQATKKELKEDYGMKQASPIGKEYYEQMAALEEWCVGKTVQEAVSGATGQDADLIAGCTIRLDAHAQALTKAAENAGK